MTLVQRTVVLILAALMPACGKSVPEEWDALVPAEGRGELELIKEVDGKGYGADKMLLLGYEEGTDLPAKHAEFAKTLEGQGYTLLGQCKTDSGQVGSQDFLKAPAEYVQVFTRTDTMLNVLFTKSLKVLEMSSDKCSFTDAAATLCKTLEGSRCSFED